MVPARGRLPPGGPRLGEQDPGAVLDDRRHAGGVGCVPREAAPSVREHGGCGSVALRDGTAVRRARRVPERSRPERPPGYVGPSDAGPRTPVAHRRGPAVAHDREHGPGPGPRPGGLLRRGPAGRRPGRSGPVGGACPRTTPTCAPPLVPTRRVRACASRWRRSTPPGPARASGPWCCRPTSRA